MIQSTHTYIGSTSTHTTNTYLHYAQTPVEQRHNSQYIIHFGHVQVVNQRGQEVTKPTAIADYSNHMFGMDKCDQLGSYYSFLHKSVKWWRKVLVAGGSYDH